MQHMCDVIGYQCIIRSVYKQTNIKETATRMIMLLLCYFFFSLENHDSQVKYLNKTIW